MPAPDAAERDRRAKIKELMEGWRAAYQLARPRRSVPWARDDGLTQWEAAQLIGVRRRSYQRIENGQQHPTRETLEAIATRLCPSPRDLMLLLDLIDGRPGTENVLPIADVFAGRPAWLVDPASTLRMCTESMSALLPGLAEHGNAAHWVFCHDTAPHTIVEFEDAAAEVIGWLRDSREQCRRHSDIVAIDALVEELCDASPLAARLWREQHPPPPVFPRTCRLRAGHTTVTVSFCQMPLGGDLDGWCVMYAPTGPTPAEPPQA